VTPELSRLLVLQHRDQRLRELHRQQQALPKERAALEEKIRIRSEALQKHRLEAQRIEAQRKEFDIEVQTLRQQIGKFRQQQLQTRKNDEYAALMHEIERAEKKIVGIEDREIEFMEAYEAAQKHVAAEVAQVGDFERSVRAQIAEVDRKIQALEALIAEEEVGRRKAREEVPADLLKRYQRLMDHRGDAAAVPLLHGNTCGGCHMTVTSQTAIDVRADRGIVSCENCARILFIPEG
jgi:uncharacterized protein